MSTEQLRRDAGYLRSQYGLGRVADELYSAADELDALRAFKAVIEQQRNPP